MRAASTGYSSRKSSTRTTSSSVVVRHWIISANACSMPALETPVADAPRKPTTGQCCPTCTQKRQQRARRPPAPFAKQDPDNAGIRREPTLPDHEAITPEEPQRGTEFALLDEDQDDDVVTAPPLSQAFRRVAPQAVLDPDDGLGI